MMRFFALDISAKKRIVVLVTSTGAAVSHNLLAANQRQPGTSLRPSRLTPLAVPDDRMPTFAEVTSFDPTTAWDRLPPDQQRAIGELAVRLAVVGNRLNYEHYFTSEEQREVERLEDAAVQAFYDGTEPLWADFYGWRAQ
ncbi:hypothetical protein [Bradyrhizobium sp. USDA 3458]|uniref:hypothetical protein n=1 Tax=Bradyrhizobium sp. USDA 3458 TaxID=2591461 RepID=UPI0011420299|nr:hypothetical protein [Bradyrhizobium sp. USDA 3458]